MNEFISDPLDEKSREIYEYIKSFLIGLSYEDAKAILLQLLNDLGKQAVVSK